MRSFIILFALLCTNCAGKLIKKTEECWIRPENNKLVCVEIEAYLFE